MTYSATASMGRCFPPQVLQTQDHLTDYSTRLKPSTVDRHPLVCLFTLLTLPLDCHVTLTPSLPTRGCNPFPACFTSLCCLLMALRPGRTSTKSTVVTDQHPIDGRPRVPVHPSLGEQSVSIPSPFFCLRYPHHVLEVRL